MTARADFPPRSRDASTAAHVVVAHPSSTAARATSDLAPVEEPVAHGEMQPPAPLGGWVVSLWRRRFASGATTFLQPALPDGCLDLISIDGGPVTLMGPETSRTECPIPGGTEIAGIRLWPGVGARLFGPAVRELVDGTALLADLPRPPVFPTGGRGVESPSEAHRVLLDALLPRLAAGGPDDGVAYGVAWLARHPGGTVDGLCERLGWSPREVRRRFESALGFGPKVMQRMVRFQRALYLAERARTRNDLRLSRLAWACGYADQAHMTREFRALAHATPRALLRGPFDVTLRNLFASPDAPSELIALVLTCDR